MAPIKRKAETTATITKFSSGEPASKRSRKSNDGSDQASRVNGSKSATNATTSTQTKKPTASSMLQSEEKGFPRGGGSVLTPLEHKQIQIEATNDVLFEQAGIKSAANDASGVENAVANSAQKLQRKAKRRESAGVKKQQITDLGEPHTKIESLSFKKLAPGSLVLGRIAQITSRDLVLALPNNLTGFVPLTAISRQLLKRIETLIKEDDDNAEDAQAAEEENPEEDEDIELSKLFTIGQYLRACVTSTGSEDSDTKQAKKRIELSIDPREANIGQSKTELVVNSVVQASVTSNEDHGLVMDLGFNDKTLKAFMSSKELPPGIRHADVQTGTVFLCLVTGLTADGRTVKLSADLAKYANSKKPHILTDAPTVDAFVPGTAVEVLITEVSSQGIAGKLMGILDVTVDFIHSGTANSDKDISTKFKVGGKVSARVLCTFPEAEPRKVGVSLLYHLTHLTSPSSKSPGVTSEPLALSSFVDEAKVIKVEPAMGLFLDVGVSGLPGFAHISRISDRRIDNLSETSGKYAPGTAHRARVVGYNAMDGLHLLSLEQRILDQEFLRMDDIEIGQVAKGTVEKLIIGGSGDVKLIVKIGEGITGLVPADHLADVKLSNPDRRFKEGTAVTARVLSRDLGKGQLRLTLKKSLVNSDAGVWADYSSIEIGAQAPGTITKVLPAGAVVRFYDEVRAFLPVSEMSEAYISNPTEHFQPGQVVNVRVTSINASEGKMTVSCKDPAAVSAEQRTAFEALEPGQVVQGSILEKTSDAITIEVQGVKSVLRLGHLTDGSEKKEASSFKRIRVGQKLENLLILRKVEKILQLVLSLKPGLLAAAKDGTLVKDFESLQEGQSVAGFVRGFDQAKVYVEFANGVSGAMFKSQMESSMLNLPEYGLRRLQSITTTVLHIDHTQRRFLLTMKDAPNDVAKPMTKLNVSKSEGLQFGHAVEATIVAVKQSQLNVELPDGSTGRIDVSEAFKSWKDISDKKRPLQSSKSFEKGKKVKASIIGYHDARNHRFLPLSHRTGANMVYELTAKTGIAPSTPEMLLSLQMLNVEETHVAFVNNITETCVWVNLSPTVRGRIDLMDLSEDVSMLQDVEAHFPIGAALQVKVKNIDRDENRLDLIARSVSTNPKLTWQQVSSGMLVPGKVMKASDRYIVVQLGRDLVGTVSRTDLADDYDEAKLANYSRNAIVRVKVVEVDKSRNKIHLSTRPSDVLNSSYKVKDRQILSAADLKVNDIVRGFVKHISDKGLFVTVGPGIDGFVRISDLSDSYLKDWKSAFQPDQVVRTKVIDVDPAANRLLLSLKVSVIDSTYAKALVFEDLAVGQVITGVIRKVLDSGVIILIDNSRNLSGLCHKSEFADGFIEDVSKLYEQGDKVKAIITKVNAGRRQVSFSMKASLLQAALDDIDGDDDHDQEMIDGGIGIEDAEASDDDDVDSHDDGVSIDLEGTRSIASDEPEEDVDTMDVDSENAAIIGKGLSTDGFDWTGDGFVTQVEVDTDVVDDGGATAKKKRKRRAEIVVDRTGDLDKIGPQSVADYERLLLGQPHDSLLWIKYMSFQYKLGEMEKAREVAQRALRIIAPHVQDEKLDIRTALLNLENLGGTDETLEEAFKEAIRYHDVHEIHNRLITICISSQKLSKADDLYQSMTKIKSITPAVDFWVSYATFLLNTLNEPFRARSLLDRARQSVPPSEHRSLATKLGALEFKSQNGDTERGRTIFEGLLSAYPAKYDLWDTYMELEKAHGHEDNVRQLYERTSKSKMKKRRAQFVFGQWRKWEESVGNSNGAEKVQSLEQQWEEKQNQKEEDAEE